MTAASTPRRERVGFDDDHVVTEAVPTAAHVPSSQSPAREPSGQQRSHRVSRRGANLFRGLIGFFVLAAMYELLARLELVDPRLLPSATVVLPRAVELAFDPAFLGQVWQTLQAVLIGIGLSFIVAVPAGLIIGSYRLVSNATTPVIDTLRSVPGIAIVPLLTLIVGQGLEMKVVLVVFVSTPTLLYNTIYGVRAVDRVAVETARTFQFGTFRTWTSVVLPSATPLIVTGLRLATAIALTVTIAAEIAVGTSSGIGYFVLFESSAGFHNFDSVYAAVVLAGLLGFGMNYVIAAVTRPLVAWDERGTG